ncbi:hypothetical protein FQN60_005560 [Etheostoma spectabile]|uniref:Uncharacterized protein n=1 Tax=Etheostoma spectabile TaxID=54343 RepID=A0A5J5CG62_9PERO|nr:hypothetical protein FQN60_005560 [Etheostoma spectabile]
MDFSSTEVAPRRRLLTDSMSVVRRRWQQHDSRRTTRPKL